jgi:hypothetical protein
MRSLPVALGALIAVLLPLAAARPAAAAASCGYAYAQPFAPWGDSGAYALAPSGAFDDGVSAGWSLAGGASVTSGGNALRPVSSGYGLSLPSGSSATSPPICVEAGSPWSRMFAQTTVRNTAHTGALKVEILFKDSKNGQTTTRTAATLAQRPTWSPTARMSLGSPVTIAPGAEGRMTVRYRFTPLHRTAWVLDDLFIDPKRHR